MFCSWVLLSPVILPLKTFIQKLLKHTWSNNFGISPHSAFFFRQLAHVIKQQFRGLVVCYPMFLAWFDAFISCFSPPVRNVFWMPRLFQSQKNLNKTVSLSQKVLLAPHACFTSIGFQAMLHGSFHLQNTTVGTGGFQAPFININCLQWNLKDCWSYSASILPSSCSWLPAWPQSGPLGAEFAQVLSQKGVH